MQTSETIDKLIPALVAARRTMLPAGKSGLNKFDKYSYATEEDWCAATMPGLLDNGLALVFSVTEVADATERKTKSGGVEYSRVVSGTARLFHTSGQWIEVSVCGEGQDRGDKAIYKALTGMKKYGYALVFALPTSDDPEKHSHESADVLPPAEPMPDMTAIAKRLAETTSVNEAWEGYKNCWGKYKSPEARSQIKDLFSQTVRDRMVVLATSATTVDEVSKLALFLTDTAGQMLRDVDRATLERVLKTQLDSIPSEP